MKVAILFGSISDKDNMKKAAKLLDEFDVVHYDYVVSAHRNPELLTDLIQKFESMGIECIIAGAGLAAHLPGVIASQTIIPVIGVPLNGALGGLDALLSIVQMPKNIPVATVGINNSTNAALLSLSILSIKYPDIKNKLMDYRKKLKAELETNFNKGVDW